MDIPADLQARLDASDVIDEESFQRALANDPQLHADFEAFLHTQAEAQANEAVTALLSDLPDDLRERLSAANVNTSLMSALRPNIARSGAGEALALGGSSTLKARRAEMDRVPSVSHGDRSAGKPSIQRPDAETGDTNSC